MAQHYTSDGILTLSPVMFKSRGILPLRNNSLVSSRMEIQVTTEEEREFINTLERMYDNTLGVVEAQRDRERLNRLLRSFKHKRRYYERPNKSLDRIPKHTRR